MPTVVGLTNPGTRNFIHGWHRRMQEYTIQTLSLFVRVIYVNNTGYDDMMPSK